jgi:hypothetical protein
MAFLLNWRADFQPASMATQKEVNESEKWKAEEEEGERRRRR